MSDPFAASGTDPLSGAIAIGQVVAKLVGAIIDLWRKHEQGDLEALSKLKRVDEILSKDSPTESAFKRYDELVASKPSRGDS